MKPLAVLPLLFAAATLAVAQTAVKNDSYPDFNYPGRTTIEGSNDWVKAITISRPELRAEVQGDVTIEFAAPGMTVARVLCWQQPTAADPNPFGHDTLIGSELKLGADGKGSVVFPADQYPSGPVTVRIMVEDENSRKKDVRELQLFNKGGVAWQQGVPKTDPPAAKGMKLVFADDFDKPLSISADGKNTTYCSHKPGPANSDFSGWQFADFEGPLNPFSQAGTYLRIHASKTDKGASSGIIAPVPSRVTGADDVKGGVAVSVPYYLECRFIAQSAPGTWPAFWTVTAGGRGCTELDIIEAYGGFGKGNPNYTGYSVTSHFWGQKDADGQQIKDYSKSIKMVEVAGKSSWSTTFHTYGVLVTETDTAYYLDDVEMLRHPTDELSKKQPAFFMINYAIGGISGWQIDLEREGNATDMWVDFVRAYQGEAVK